jgi:hypothetical protein
VWVGENPYHDLWPGQLELALRSAIPARVAALMGWNQLVDGDHALVDAPVEIQPAVDAPLSGGNRMMPAPASVWAPFAPASTEIPAPQSADSALSGEMTAVGLSTLDRLAASKAPPVATSRAHRLEREALRQEIEEMAARHNLAGVTRLDGRFPVYVLFSTRGGLQSTYGRRAAKALEAEMAQLVETIQRKPGWGARLFLADDPVSATSLGIRPAKPNDPWALKLALADLDAALAAQGEMIGALLIVGDPEVVPFHRLPNPLDDQDDEVPSDNPYATRDKNYFIPEWPVGRLPAGGDPRLLMELLQRIRKKHAGHLKALPWHRKIFQRLQALVRSRGARARASFGYTAAIWRQAAEVVYRPIGNPRVLQVSPPRGVFEGTFLNPLDPVDAQQGLEGGVALPVGRLGYFNLHGLVDAAEWYGQRDPLQGQAGPDYPVALRPEDIAIAANGKKDAVPRVVFSEACYGLHIQGRVVDQAMALKFLQAGSLAVAGSTCMAYGSVETPLVAADLLGQAFWRAIQDGVPAGEALRQAKITLAGEMDRRQGFLDGEDQKTLVSFLLFGDPLAQVEDGALQSKGVLRLATPLPEVKTICDRLADPPNGSRAPADVLASVRDVVSHYLPGMSDADVSVAYPRVNCNGEGHSCPTSQLGGAAKAQCRQACPAASGHRLVTLSKMVPRTEGVHAHYARLTLDARGGLVKLVVSR